MIKTIRALMLLLTISLIATKADLLGASQAPTNERLPSSHDSNVRPKTEFEIVTRADVTDNDDGTRFAQNSYRARDGVMVTELHGTFGTVARADFYFNKDISKAIKVELREIKRNKKGNAIGKRAQIVLRLDPPDSRDIPVVVWTSATDFYELISDSLPHILALEKELTP